MFCPQCGEQDIIKGRYCVQCGAQLPASLEQFGRERADDFRAEQIGSTPENLGATIKVWKKTRLTGRHKSKPIFDVGWLSSEVDVVLATNAVVVVAASPVSKVYSSVEKISSVAIAAGAIGGFLITLPLAIVAEAHEKLFGTHNELEERALGQLFKVGRVLWIPKSKARFRYIEVRGRFWEYYENVCAVSGFFEHIQGPLECCLSLSGDHDPKLSAVLKEFEKHKFPFDHVYVKKRAEIHQLLDSEYPYPNWSKILAHVL